jgi:hypothetical protein
VVKFKKGLPSFFTSMSYPVTVEVNSLEQFSKLMQFCTENGIYIGSQPANPFKPAALSRENKKPSPAFLSFCGAENLNRLGLTNEQSVYDMIVRYTTKLVLSDGSIQLDAPLQAALQTDKTRIYEHELLSLIPKIFI